MDKLTFKPVVASQRELIYRWLNQDYIQQWVHGQGLQNVYKGLEKFLEYQEQEKSFDNEEITQHWIGYDDNKPFVYLLTFNLSKQIPNEYTQYCELEGPAITLDIFICDPYYLGKGLATTIIRQFLLNHFADVTEVFIDPEKTNTRAVHVYQKVGFNIVGEFIASWHPVPHYIMKITLDDLRKNCNNICT